MKYMGSKRSMLLNGLGSTLSRKVRGVTRFVDLFTGSAAVATHIATKYDVPVVAYDLQKYSTVLAEAVIGRDEAVNGEAIWNEWHQQALEQFQTIALPPLAKVTQDTVAEVRDWCDEQQGLPITKAYGGHYFSPEQVVWLDALRATVPQANESVALAALIQTASQCAAAPGHTAQPFQPTRTAKRYLEDAWKREVPKRVKDNLLKLSKLHARQIGHAEVRDANDAATELQEGDLVFIDPPYSGVHYSRFYHVLETIANGVAVEVSGRGRYPAQELRPRSSYSVSTESNEAMEELLETVAAQGASAIVTFPDHDCSNGLSGDAIRHIADEYFRMGDNQVDSKLSSLGGRGDGEQGEAGRVARKHTKELILVLDPK